AAALANFPDAGVVRIVDTTQSIDTYLKYILNNRTTPALEFEAGSLPFTDGYTLPDKSTITSASIINGNIDKTYTIRKSILGAWLMYPGSLINQMQLTFTQGQFAQVEADVISANEVMSPTNIASAELPAPSGNIHNTVDNFLGCSLLDKSPAGCITAASITLARNGSKADYGTGHADACGIITGQFEASGSVSFYYRTEDEYQAALAGRQGPVVIKSVDSAGNGYAFVFLNAALRNPQLQTESVNKTYELKLDIEGNPTSSGATFAIFRITSGS
ncbi:phage tail protein, partial [Acetobacter malorum]